MRKKMMTQKEQNLQSLEEELSVEWEEDMEIKNEELNKKVSQYLTNIIFYV
jgi:hypothetical protein